MTTQKKMAIIAGVILLLALAFANYRYVKYMKGQYETMAKSNAGLLSQNKEFRDNNGNLHTQVTQLQVDRAAYMSTHEVQVDSMAKLLDIRAKNIEELVTVIQKYQGEFVSKIDTNSRIAYVKLPGRDSLVRDTVYYYTVKYKDRWLDFKGILDTGRFSANYTLTDSLTLVTFIRKQGFLGLGRAKTFVDISGTNPNLTFSNLSSVELTKVRDKRWSIGPYVGYGWTGTGFGVSFGISLQRSLIRF